jgi:hypothetical protein
VARLIRPHDGVVVGLREHLAARCRATIAKLEHSTECELYDFSAERNRPCDRLIDIMSGADVTPVYLHEIPRDMLPLRDGRMVYTLRGDRLVPAEYERVAVDY